MSEHISDQELELMSFGSEIALMSLAKIADIEAEFATVQSMYEAHGLTNPTLIEATNAAYNSQIAALSAGLGETAIQYLPPNRIANQLAEVNASEHDDTEQVQTTMESITAYAKELSTVVPEAEQALIEKSREIAESLLESSKNKPASTEIKRAAALTAIDAVLSTPITSPIVERQLLDYFNDHESKDEELIKLIPVQRSPLSKKELTRQIEGATPRERMYDYFRAFVGYPIEVATLSELAYINDDRPMAEKLKVGRLSVYPGQLAGKKSYKDLAIEGVVLQMGWINSSTAKPKRVVRSLYAADYDPSIHVGTSIGNDRHTWESIDEELLIQARA